MRIAIALLLFATSVHADVAKAKQGVLRCRAEGTPIVELEYRDVTPDAEQLTVVLYANGTQTATRSDGKNRPVDLTRCRTDDEMKPIKAALKTATWKITHARITCKARTSKSTVVKIDGRVVITEQLCGADSLDEVSAKKLAEIESFLPTPTSFEKCLANPLAIGCT